MKRARFRPWIEPSRCCRCGRGFRPGRRTTTCAMAPPRCLLRSTCWREPSSVLACRASGTSSSCSSWSASSGPRPGAGTFIRSSTTTATNIRGKIKPCRDALAAGHENLGTLTGTAASRGLAPTGAAASLLSLVACAVPLGPSYTVEEQQLEVRYVATSRPHRGVRASYRLINTGNQALSSLEVTLPAEKAYGRQNLRVLLDNQELAPQVVSEPQKDTFRISFDAAWPRRARHAIEIAYDLTAGVESDPRIVMGRDAFVLCSGSWYPLF